MQLSYLFTVFLAANLASASPAPVEEVDSHEGSQLQKRECWWNGVEWGDKIGPARDALGWWCSGNGGPGVYRAGLTRHYCKNFDNGKSAHFYMQNQADYPRDLTKAECNRLLSQHFNCRGGGEGTNNKWHYS